MAEKGLNMSVQDIADLSPHLVVNCGSTVHVIAVSEVRLLARGHECLSDKDDVIRLLATALTDNLDKKQ